MAEYEYILDNKWEAARKRLTLLEHLFDGATVRNLKRVGVGAGWSCLELGAGAGSIAGWLCQQVGPAGLVLATDLEPHLLESMAAPNLKVERHNVLTDPLPDATFDLIHARALLWFLPDPKTVIRKMVSALKPGGWLLVEEPDYISATPDPSMTPLAAALSKKGWDALLRHFRSRGYDTAMGRSLYHHVLASGLADIEAEGFVSMQLGGTPTARFWRVTFEQVQSDLLAAGLLTETEATDYRELLESENHRWLSITVMSVSGRRPEAV